MVKTRSGVLFVLAAGISVLALVTSAAGTSARGPTSMRLHVPPLEALALDGNRVAYDVARTSTSRKGKREAVAHPNRVFVWNLRTGKTINVSGRRGTGADSHTRGGRLGQLAIAGTRVAWLIQASDDDEAADDLYISSAQRPKVRHVAKEVRRGDACVDPAHSAPGISCGGDWLGGLVGAGNRLLVIAGRPPPTPR